MKTKEQIIVDLRDKISEILSVPADTVEKSESFWELFPRPNRVTPKKTREFLKYVVSEYKVYLTDDEWELVNTLSKLADHIIEKQSNPQHMLAQIRKDLANRKDGYRQNLVFVSVFFGGFLLWILYSIITFKSGTVVEAFKGIELRRLFIFAALIVSCGLTAVLGNRTDKKRFKEEIAPVLQHYNYNPEEKSPDKK
jgi:hypothetical protein